MGTNTPPSGNLETGVRPHKQCFLSVGTHKSGAEEGQIRRHTHLMSSQAASDEPAPWDTTVVHTWDERQGLRDWEGGTA